MKTYLNPDSANIPGAVNPRDSDLSIVSDADHIVFTGFKNFNTGGVVSDLTVLEGVYAGTEHHIFAFTPTQQAGIRFAVSWRSFQKHSNLHRQHNWNNIGLRLTESGSVKIDNVAVPWEDALGWDPKEKKPIESILSIPWAGLL